MAAANVKLMNYYFKTRKKLAKNGRRKPRISNKLRVAMVELGDVEKVKTFRACEIIFTVPPHPKESTGKNERHRTDFAY